MSSATRSRDGSTRTYLYCVLVCCANSLTNLGFSAVALVSSDGDAGVNEEYASSRSLALALISLGLLRWRSRRAGLALAGVLTLMQLGDAVVGVRLGEPIKCLGPPRAGCGDACAARTLWSARFEDDAVEFRFRKGV